MKSDRYKVLRENSQKAFLDNLKEIQCKALQNAVI